MVLKEGHHLLIQQGKITFTKILLKKKEVFFFIMEMLQMQYQYLVLLKKLDQMKFTI